MESVDDLLLLEPPATNGTGQTGQRTLNLFDEGERPVPVVPKNRKFNIRLYEDDDFGAVKALFAEWGADNIGGFDVAGLAVVAENETQEIVGFVVARSMEDGTFVVENFLIRPSLTWAGRGLRPNRVMLPLYRGILERIAEKNPRRIAFVVPARNQHVAKILSKLLGLKTYQGPAHVFIAEMT